MNREELAALREELARKKAELESRLGRIRQNLTRGLDSDSKERAKELEDSEVVDALGNEALDELRLIRATLERIDAGDYGFCRRCGNPIRERRLAAWRYASQCIDCARDDERAAARG